MALTQKDESKIEGIVTSTIKKTVPGIVTKIVNEVVIDASHTILEGVQRMLDIHNEENKRDFKKLSEDLDTVKNDIKYIKDDINGIEG